MMTRRELQAEFGIGEVEIAAWIEQQWVRPLRQGDDAYFDDCDVARCQLIVELRRDLAVNEEALPVVLSLLDQLYATRKVLRTVGAALAALPDPALDEVRTILEKTSRVERGEH